MPLSAWPTVTDDSGTKQDGTIFNKALTDAIRASIEAAVFSTTNPSVTAEDIIDEVVAARGSKASLDARLDVSLNEDGTPKANAANLPTATYTEGLGSLNVCLNGDMENWTAGTTSAPDNWVLAGAGGTIAKTGPGLGDTFTFGSGTYTASITRAGTDVTLTQTVVSAANWANHEDVEGGIVAAAMNAKTGSPNVARLQLNDGVSTGTSSYHTGGGSAEWLTATRTIDAAATKLEVILQTNNTNTVAYFGGVMVVFASVAPTRWQPMTGQAVTGLAQTFAGVKTFVSAPVGVPTFARCTAALTKNANITPANITGLSFTVGASEVWAFQFVLKGVSATAADWRFAATGPAAPTAVWYGVTHTDGTTAATATAFATDIFSTGFGIDNLVFVSGLLRNGANSGTVQLQAAQWTSDVSDSIIRAESYVIAWRIS